MTTAVVEVVCIAVCWSVSVVVDDTVDVIEDVSPSVVAKVEEVAGLMGV